MTPELLASWLSHPLSVLLLCALAIFALFRGWWVPGAWHRQALAEQKEQTLFWRTLALRHLTFSEGQVQLADRGMTVAEKALGLEGQQ